MVARINGAISGDSAYALISTPESVYVWSYVTPHSDPVVLTFPIRSIEPPLASLVSPNAGSVTLNRVTGAASIHRIVDGLEIFTGTCVKAQRVF